MSGNESFAKSEILSMHLALLISMCLHDVLRDSLGAMKFDVEFYSLTPFLKHSPPSDFEMSCALFRIAIYCRSCLHCALSCLT